MLLDAGEYPSPFSLPPDDIRRANQSNCHPHCADGCDTVHHGLQTLVLRSHHPSDFDSETLSICDYRWSSYSTSKTSFFMRTVSRAIHSIPSILLYRWTAHTTVSEQHYRATSAATIRDTNVIHVRTLSTRTWRFADLAIVWLQSVFARLDKSAVLQSSVGL